MNSQLSCSLHLQNRVGEGRIRVLKTEIKGGFTGHWAGSHRALGWFLLWVLLLLPVGFGFSA